MGRGVSDEITPGGRKENVLAKILRTKLIESLTSVAPVSLLVILLSLTPLVQLTLTEIIVFSISSVFLILGIGLFNIGADLAMSPMGDHIGSGLTKSKSMTLLLIVCFAMGMLVTVAEPDLSVLAKQIGSAVNGTALILFVGFGVGLFLLLAVLKIVFHSPLSMMLLFFYMVLFALTALVAVNGADRFLPLAFDSGGVTTGPITVPFIMALGVGIAATLGGKNVGENSFGLIALCSVGPMIAVMLLAVGISDPVVYEVPDYASDASFWTVIKTLLSSAKEVGVALILIVVSFVALNLFFLHLPLAKLKKIAVGILFTFVGLVIFLAAVSVGFMPIGYKIGTEMAGESPILLAVFGLILGMLTVLAEPAVHVLNKQVEDVTDGMVSKKSMMIALSVGVGTSICLSMVRMVLGFNILYYLIPGYFISLGLAFFVPGLYTAIAFDSGGVASGPLTSSFILPFAVGACAVLGGDVMTEAFGIVSMVAMTPLITIQVLGFRAITARRVRHKIAIKRILAADDEQIIDF